MAGLATAALLLNSGCAVIRDELRYPGGAPGRLLDRRTFDSSQSKQLALLRATLALAISARIGEASVATEDAGVFARQLAEAALEINYAAVDAGYPHIKKKEGGTEKALPTCSIPSGNTRDDPRQFGQPDDGVVADLEGRQVKLPDFQRSYRDIDQDCAGYFVNFESNISRIEARIVKAMLTALPAESARKFLEDVTKGDVFSALWSLTRSLGDLAAAFHRGAGVYRAGIENVAASTPSCDQKEPLARRFRDYHQDRDTVLVAAACLGLSNETLFDSETISADQLPSQVAPAAFLALFRIVRIACVALPLQNLA